MVSAFIESLLLAAEDLERDQRRIVECHYESGLDSFVFPKRLDQVGPLYRAVRVLGRFVRITLSDLFDKEFRRHPVTTQVLVDLHPAEGAIWESGQERRPNCILTWRIVSYHSSKHIDDVR